MIVTVRQQLQIFQLVLLSGIFFWSLIRCHGFSSSPIPNPDNKSTSALGLTKRPALSRRSPGGGGGGGGPKGDRRHRERREQRRQHQQRNNQQQNVKFDGKAICSQQHHNLEAPPFDLERILLSSSSSTAPAPTQSSGTPTNTNLRCISGQALTFEPVPLGEKEDNASSFSPYFEYMSLDDLEFERTGAPHIKFRLKGFSEKFNADVDFRSSLRSAIRQDIFRTTPFYQNLPAKAASILLLPDSSLEGSWKIPTPSTAKNDDMDEPTIRMKYTTKVLQDAFSSVSSSGEDDPLIPTGDELFQAIGRLCSNENGSELSSSARTDGSTGGASTHFIDIYGRQDRTINHSWHMDAGKAGFLPDRQVCRTLIWGFPARNEINYRGCGVFSHIVKLKHSCSLQELNHLDEDTAPSATLMEPVLFDGVIDPKYVVRPPYQPGNEILLYRDIDCLHSAPDCTYRSSIMRFM